MQTEAFFENIAEKIEEEINKAQQSIYIVVAWFTNKTLFNALINKTNKGCVVKLLISNNEINLNSKNDFSLLKKGNSNVFWIGDGNSELMHNKFCVIDHNVVITGSYNWSYKAENNFENIVVTSDDTRLTEQFVKEFYQIVQVYYPYEKEDGPVFPVDKIIKRLEILKNYIQLEDEEELQRETQKLKAFSSNSDLSEIIEYIRKKEYVISIQKIQSFILSYQVLAVWNDPEIAALKLEIKNLENIINAFDNEKIELEKIVSDFQHRHTIELGETIIEILRKRKILYKDDKEKLEEAENDERSYSEQLNDEKKREVFELTEDEKFELKRSFRKATMICHPDKVSDHLVEDAEKVFIELKNAYDDNNLKRVNEILIQLEKGNYFKPKSETVTEKDVLKSAIAKLKLQIQVKESEIIAIKESEAYQTIISIIDWDEYFEITKQKLQEELAILNKELNLANSD